MSTLSEFASRYAERSGKTVADLYMLGYRAYPCDCGESNCEGFKMLSGDARCYHEYSEMIGKPDGTLTVDEIKTALAGRNSL